MDLQRGEQALRAVALVLVLAPRGLIGRGRGVGLGRGFGLDAGLLVDADDQHVLRRVDVEAADGRAALLELRL